LVLPAESRPVEADLGASQSLPFRATSRQDVRLGNMVCRPRYTSCDSSVLGTDHLAYLRETSLLDRYLEPDSDRTRFRWGQSARTKDTNKGRRLPMLPRFQLDRFLPSRITPLLLNAPFVLCKPCRASLPAEIPRFRLTRPGLAVESRCGSVGYSVLWLRVAWLPARRAKPRE
jgi:hypothetical protein